MSIVVRIAGWNKISAVAEETNRSTNLVVYRICHVPALESLDEPHGIRNVTQTSATRCLFTGHADIDKNPQNKAWPELVERLDIK